MIRRTRRARAFRKLARKRGFTPSFRLCYRICAAANKERIHDYDLMALVEQESGFKFIFGHDAGGPYPGLTVTHSRYLGLLQHIRNGGTSNGVGYVQATYGLELLNHPGLWKPKANLRWGAKFQKSFGLDEAGLNRYNGDPTGAYGRRRVEIRRAYESVV